MKLRWSQLVLYACALGMEGSAFYVVLLALNKAVGERVSVPGLLALYPVAFAFNLFLRWLGWHRLLRGAINIVVWAFALLLMVKLQLYGGMALFDATWWLALPRAFANLIYAFDPEMMILLASGMLWWVGRRLAYVRLGSVALLTEFQFGLAVVLIVFFTVGMLNIELANSVEIALVFFFFALLGVSLAHAQEGSSWLTSLKQGHWSGLLLISIGLVLVLGVVISIIVTPGFLQMILNALGWVWNQIVRLIDYLISLLPPPSPAEPIPGLSTPMPAPNEETQQLFTIPENILAALRLGWEILMLGIALFALWRISSDIFGWLRRRLKGSGNAEVESLKGAFQADFLNLLKRVFFWLLRIRLPARQPKKEEPAAITSVRQLYREFLKWGNSHGYPRLAFQTPHEYGRRLAGLLPSSDEALGLLTQSYVSARYGSFSPSDEQLNILRQSWHNIKQNQLRRPDSTGLS